MTVEEEKEEMHFEMEGWRRALSQNPVVLCPVGMKPGTHLGLCGPSIKKECFGEVPKKKKKRENWCS